MKSAAPAPRFALIFATAMLALPLLLMACADLNAPAASESEIEATASRNGGMLPSRLVESVDSIEVRESEDGPNFQITFKPGTPDDVKTRVRRHIETKRRFDDVTFNEDGSLTVEGLEVDELSASPSLLVDSVSISHGPVVSLPNSLPTAIQQIGVRGHNGETPSLRVIVAPGVSATRREAIRTRLAEMSGASEVIVEVARTSTGNGNVPSSQRRQPRGPHAETPARGTGRAYAAPADTIVPFAVIEDKPRVKGKRLQERVEYPASAQRVGIEGTVFLQFVVDVDGRPRDIRVLRSPHESLSKEAIRALRETHFEPGHHQGEPVPVRMSLPVRFSLSSEASPEPGPPKDPSRDASVRGNVIPFAVIEEKPRIVGDPLQATVEYPSSAENAGIEGTVFLQFVVGTDGQPRDINVLRSPHESLSKEAVRALRDARFEPGRNDGQAVPVRMSLPVRFQL